jgi:hypothetical protein
MELCIKNMNQMYCKRKSKCKISNKKENKKENKNQKK